MCARILIIHAHKNVNMQKKNRIYEIPEHFGLKESKND